MGTAYVGIRTAELDFSSKKNRRAGAQTFLSDGEEKVEGEIPGAPTKMISLKYAKAHCDYRRPGSGEDDSD